MSDSDLEPGLRERKRRATRRAILVAAVQVVRERGLEGATVDEISRVADVSPRTFFNYFPTKEEAILGGAPALSPDVVDEFLADRGPLLDAVARAISGSIDPLLSDPEMAQMRRDTVKAIPELVARRMAGLHRFEMEIIELVRRRLTVEDPSLAADERALADRARLVAVVSIAAMRHAWVTWIERGDDGDNELADRMHESFGQMGALIVSSISD